MGKHVYVKPVDPTKPTKGFYAGLIIVCGVFGILFGAAMIVNVIKGY